MSDDIVERLQERHVNTWHSGSLPSIFGSAADEIERLRQMMFDAYRTLGFDTDGDTTYHAHVGWPDSVFPKAMAEMRADYDEACDEIERLRGELVEVGRANRDFSIGEAEMRSEIENLRAQVAAWHSVATQLADTSHALGRAQALIAWIDGACTDGRPHADIEAAIGRWKDTPC